MYKLVTSTDFSEDSMRQLEGKDKKQRDNSVLQFEKACQKASVEYAIQRNRKIAIQELLHESIYCDLLIIDYNETFTHYKENPPTRFIGRSTMPGTGSACQL